MKRIRQCGPEDVRRVKEKKFGNRSNPNGIPPLRPPPIAMVPQPPLAQAQPVVPREEKHVCEDVPVETLSTEEISNSCLIETSTLTQTGTTIEQDKPSASIEAGGHLRQPTQMRCSTSEKGCEKATNDLETFQLQKELKEKDAELLKYKQGLIKLEEILQEKQMSNPGLLQQTFLEAVAFAKAEKAVLKEALDAQKLSHQAITCLIEEGL
ncbi:hypothetical protein L7F22_000492 [Adiantum nelumboides]|nr:hypothetical protein [Adiantum nelumboides]